MAAVGPTFDLQATDTGTVIEITVTDGDQPISNAVDISAATTKEFVFRKKGSSSSTTVTAVFSDTGTDGKLKYTTLVSDFPTGGSYEIQVHLITPTFDRLTSKGVLQIGVNV